MKAGTLPLIPHEALLGDLSSWRLQNLVCPEDLRSPRSNIRQQHQLRDIGRRYVSGPVVRFSDSPASYRTTYRPWMLSPAPEHRSFVLRRTEEPLLVVSGELHGREYLSRTQDWQIDGQ